MNPIHFLDANKVLISCVIGILVALNHTYHAVPAALEESILIFAASLGLYGIKTTIENTPVDPSNPLSARRG